MQIDQKYLWNVFYIRNKVLKLYSIENGRINVSTGEVWITK